MSTPFHVLTKPIGPICNLDCQYCFYLEKENLYPNETNWRMSDAVLEEYVRQYIEAQPGHEVHFAWQGGEPTLLGLDFFRKAIALQRKYANGKAISNALQTNGTLLDREWCDFLAREKVLVGISIDGPRELHDCYRLDKGQKVTFDAVMRGLSLLKEHQVEFNTLTVVHRANSQRPLDVYGFLKEIGSRFLQFIPLVERTPQSISSAPPADANVVFAAPARAVSGPPLFGTARDPERNPRLNTSFRVFAAPPDPSGPGESNAEVTPESVLAEDYGRFLSAIFDEWLRADVGRIFVQLFDVALSNWMGLGSPLCVFAETCGAALAMEHNGDLYSCDHYVYPKYRLGNLLRENLGDMARSAPQHKFGADKRDTLPQYCRRCEVRFACNGECPKHRFIRTPDGEPGLNYLCAAYKMFFTHVDPYMRLMAELLQNGLPAAEIMHVLG